MRHYLESPFALTPQAGRLIRKPRAAAAIDAAGGLWKLCWEGPNTHLVVFEDFGNPAVLTSARATPNAFYLGTTPPQRPNFTDQGF